MPGSTSARVVGCFAVVDCAWPEAIPVRSCTCRSRRVSSVVCAGYSSWMTARTVRSRSERRRPVSVIGRSFRSPPSSAVERSRPRTGTTSLPQWHHGYRSPRIRISRSRRPSRPLPGPSRRIDDKCRGIRGVSAKFASTRQPYPAARGCPAVGFPRLSGTLRRTDQHQVSAEITGCVFIRHGSAV